MKSKDELGDRMKSYEEEYEKLLPSDKCIVLRLDGRAFSKYTRHYSKPFSYSIRNSMLIATKNLVDEFHACFGYTQSDEITIVIPSKQREDGSFVEHIFSGRSMKISSIASSLASVSFYSEINSLGTEKNLPMFDCRVMSMDKHEATNAVFWRMLDARRNAVSSMYRHTFGHRAMQGKSSNQMIEDLSESWKSLMNFWKHGTFVYDDLSEGVIGSDDLFWSDHSCRYFEVFREDYED